MSSLTRCVCRLKLNCSAHSRSLYFCPMKIFYEPDKRVAADVTRLIKFGVLSGFKLIRASLPRLLHILIIFLVAAQAPRSIPAASTPSAFRAEKLAEMDAAIN